MPVIQPPVGDTTTAPQQRSQPSRKGKKAWRKNVDVSDVEKGLADLNEEIIRGGVIREKPSEELFTLDVARDPKVPKKQPKSAPKQLKADQIINKRSHVPAVSMRKRPADKTTDGLVPTKRIRSDWVSHKELARLKRMADGQHESTLATRDASYDVWGAPATAIAQSEAKDADPESGFLPPQKTTIKAPKSLKQEPVSLLANGKQVRAVQKPTGGYSYNPAFTDYEKRLEEESRKAFETEKKRIEAEEAERLRKEAAAKSAAEAEAAEARADLSEWEEDSEWEGFQSGVEDDDKTRRAKRPARKTQAQRNRALRRKEEERLAKQKAAIKAQRTQEQRIADIAKEVDERAAKDKQLVLADDGDDSSSDDADVDDNNLRRRQLGKYKLPERDLELVLPDELQESLRLLKPEGNLLKDRYRSMLVRGKVESRRHIPFKRKAKRKLTEKWTHKDFVL